ncbi:potassium-transporting ATPase subunit KdpB [Streptomyces noursei]|uniref:Potassium-transporting ATPase ATP-binding subunit n=1 Tax=Streptomyces noursei TaxID=1971 RepID=A0A401QUA5_STRNR|nr:HAD-IC family P-type ATPase [Streptomyces noursei]UWS70270.1 potassium-transporting ATPase subunit B [Streptomyces noursei]GCB88967.1 potassium-transporting ATPase ATP-binding subunit [Streptomyces noursei]
MPAAPSRVPSIPQTEPVPGPVGDPARGAPGGGGRRGRRRRASAGLFDPRVLLTALPEALRKLHPRVLAANPVLFVVACGSLLTTLSAVLEPSVFSWVISGWLWLTVLFAQLAEAVAEGRGRAQAASLRRARTDLTARRLRDNWRVGVHLDSAVTETVPASDLRPFDFVLVAAGETVPADGEVVEGVASIDESAVTGESAPVLREAGGDRSGVTGGTTVLSDRIVVRITSRAGHSFLDRMIALVEGAARQRTPNEIALHILLAALTIIFLLVVVTLQPMATYAGAAQQTAVLVALLVTLIPTTIGALLSAIGIAGMDRLVQRNVVAMSGRAVEAAGDINTLLLDKTGTITLGHREAVAFVPLPGLDELALADAAALSSLSDQTPEGRSVVALARAKYGLRAPDEGELSFVRYVAFSARTRMSGVDLRWSDGSGAAGSGPAGSRSTGSGSTGSGSTGAAGGPSGAAGGPERPSEYPGEVVLRKGAAAQIVEWVAQRGGEVPPEARLFSDAISASGGTPLLVAVEDRRGPRVLGVVHLKDVVKEGIRERFAELRRMGIRTVMVTGDNPLTAAAIAHEAGVDDYLAEATPEEKLGLITREQAGGRLVAMTGDGTNDAPALAQADVGVAMNTGTSAAKEAGNMVDLDSNPTKLIEIVEVGKQLLITRGALTTFSITNDVAKYFAIIPAMFTGVYPGLSALNVMELHSPTSAITSAIVFNALVIVALIPLALRGVRYRPASAHDLLRRNLAFFGLGGLVAPFVGIKLIDLVISGIPGLG